MNGPEGACSPDRRKGKFSRKSKLTFTEEVMKSEHFKPSPASYELMRAKKLRGRNRVNVVGAASPKDAKISFADSAEWYGA